MAIVGDRVMLYCNSSLAHPVDWRYRPRLVSDETEIVVDGEVVNGNRDRMSLVDYNLIIYNVLLNDTGIYTCIEKTGLREHRKISLTVSGFSFLYVAIRFLLVINLSDYRLQQ